MGTFAFLGSAGGGGGGAAAGLVALPFSAIQVANASSNAFKGVMFTPDYNMDVHSLVFGLQTDLNAIYKAAIITVSGGQIATITSSGNRTGQVTAANLNEYRFDFSPAVSLTASTEYGLIVGRTDSTDNHVTDVYATAYTATIPEWGAVGDLLSITENDPVVTTSVTETTVSTAVPAFGIIATRT